MNVNLPIKISTLILISIVLGKHGFSQVANNRVIPLGTQECVIKYHRQTNAVATFIALHEDENTCVQAYAALPDSINFNLLELHQNNKRLLTYTLDKQQYRFDPNRIFSLTGIFMTLRENNRSLPAGLPNAITAFADSLTSIIFSDTGRHAVIAIHNNTEGNYSIRTYINAAATELLHISATQDSDDFFIVTDSTDYAFLKALDENVVLQGYGAEDDGSLSLYCKLNDISYINIEAQHGHMQKQRQMMMVVYRMLLGKE